jgi:hypothetical protein
MDVEVLNFPQLEAFCAVGVRSDLLELPEVADVVADTLRGLVRAAHDDTDHVPG